MGFRRVALLSHRLNPSCGKGEGIESSFGLTATAIVGRIDDSNSRSWEISRPSSLSPRPAASSFLRTADSISSILGCGVVPISSAFAESHALENASPFLHISALQSSVSAATDGISGLYSLFFPACGEARFTELEVPAPNKKEIDASGLARWFRSDSI